MILAMTIAQMLGAVPISRMGRNFPAATCFRLLVAFRTLCLLLVTLCVYYRTPFPWLITLVALAGSVNGAAYGYLRLLLNRVAPASNLPRALGIAATLNELTFVLGPVLASVLDGASSILAVLALAVPGAVLAPLATWYALVLEDLAPEHGRAEVFAQLRTARAIGIITTSTALTVVPVSTALILVTAMMAGVTLAVALASRPGRWRYQGAEKVQARG